MAWKDVPPKAPVGKSLLLYWENPTVTYDQIINGSQDAIIRNFALEVGPNTYLAPFDEMNLNESPWFGPAAKEIAAWQHLHDLIGNKVKWVWAVNNVSIPNTAGNHPSDYYPGSSYVDIAGFDAFDYSNENWPTASENVVNELKPFGKPIWATSVGAHGSNQLSFVQDMIRLAPNQGISALVYFDYNADLPFALSAQSLAAFHL